MSSRSKYHDKRKYKHRECHHKHCLQCRGKPGPPGPMGPPGSLISFVPSVINCQSKIIESIDINNTEGEIVVITITADIPRSWKTYDLVISGEVFADETDVHTGVVMTLRRGNTVIGDLVGAQVLGYNGTIYHNGIGFSGYHKEIINNQKITGEIKFCLTIKAIDNLLELISDIVVINRSIHLQAFRQS